MNPHRNAFYTTEEAAQAQLEAVRANRQAQTLGLFNGYLVSDQHLDSEDQLNTDLMILDWVVWGAIVSIFNWHDAQNNDESVPSWQKPALKIQMANHWIHWVARNHDEVTSVILNRIKILQFLICFTQRLEREASYVTTASLEQLRNENRARAAWMESNGSFISRLPAFSFDPNADFPLPQSELHYNRIRLARDLQISDPDHESWAKEHYGTARCASLYDLLPNFFRLTASLAEGEWAPSEQWRALAGEWMLQAALEAYLVYGASGKAQFREIFAFGLPPLMPSPVTQLNDPCLNNESCQEALRAMELLFCDPENAFEEDAHWKSVRAQYLSALMPDDSPSIISAQTMEVARAQFDMKGFNKNVCGFLKNLHQGLTKPDYVQVLEGKIEGLTPEGHRELYINIGWEQPVTHELDTLDEDVAHLEKVSQTIVLVTNTDEKETGEEGTDEGETDEDETDEDQTDVDEVDEDQTDEHEMDEQK